MPATASPAAKSVAELLAERTALEKKIADTELPVLADLRALVDDDKLAAVMDKVRALHAKLGAGNSSAIVGHFLTAYASARQTVTDDIHRHERTKAIP